MDLSKASILQRVRLGARNRRVKSRRLKPAYANAPSELAIIPSGSDGFALVYLDETGAPLGQTTHERLALAIGQAEFEFAVAPNDWELMSRSS